MRTARILLADSQMLLMEAISKLLEPELTLRQREVLQLLAAGRSMKEIAFALQIKPRTVAYHKYRMMDDFNLGSSAALMRFALREEVA